MAKFGFKHYFKPTPKRIRIFGDSLAASAVFFASYAAINGMPVLGTIVLLSGWAGKFISNFFTDEPAEAAKPDQPDGQKPENP